MAGISFVSASSSFSFSLFNLSSLSFLSRVGAAGVDLLLSRFDLCGGVSVFICLRVFAERTLALRGVEGGLGPGEGWRSRGDPLVCLRGCLDVCLEGRPRRRFDRSPGGGGTGRENHLGRFDSYPNSLTSGDRDNLGGPVSQYLSLSTASEKVTVCDPCMCTVGTSNTPWRCTVGTSNTLWMCTVGTGNTPWRCTVGTSNTPWRCTVGTSNTPWRCTVGTSNTLWMCTVGTSNTLWMCTVGTSNTLWRCTVGTSNTLWRCNVGTSNTLWRCTVRTRTHCGGVL